MSAVITVAIKSFRIDSSPKNQQVKSTAEQGRENPDVPKIASAKKERCHAETS
jgi:hypothetical protein